MRKEIFFTLCLAVILISAAHAQADRDIIFQASTINALMDGVYDGDITFETLKKYGDFGIGTFNGLDGEMVALEGAFYQIKVDGRAYPVSESMKSPFSVVTFFDIDTIRALNKELDFGQLQEYLDTLLTNKNLFYAVKIRGIFKYVKTRSVPMQEKPYPKLLEAVKKQRIFEFHNVEGTIGGFRCPDYVKGVNVPGYHLHFLTEDKKAGGHLLDCVIKDVIVETDESNEFYLSLPRDEEFSKADLAQDKEAELEKIEK